MNRRHLLAGLGTALGGTLAGCADDRRDTTGNGDGTEPSERDQRGAGTDSPVRTRNEQGGPLSGNVELPVPESELNRGARKDAIPAITDPSFAPDWTETSAATDNLRADDVVIGVERGGEARAYPLRVLNWHEVVNDTFDGPLLVTYCPLCGSAVTAERLVDGTATTFGVSGLLWQSDLVMYDEATGSLWSQILATAIRGEMTGTELTLVPSSFTTWGEWRDSHPETTVLLPPPLSGTVAEYGARNYNRDPYDSYAEDRSIGIGYNEFDDDRLHPKATVIGVTAGDVSKAYPLSILGENATITDAVGNLPVVVTTTKRGSLSAYDQRVDGETLSFENAGARQMRAGGSRWRKTTGEALDGPFEGTQLGRANDRSPMFWFAWLDFNPGTAVYGVETTP